MKEKTLILIRGASGSGKSTLAKRLIVSLGSLGVKEHYEADMYFFATGEYKFDPAKLKEAHAWCLGAATRDMQLGVPFVIVSNTFTEQWELLPYFRAANECEYLVFVIRCENDFGNVHGVPDEKVRQQRARMVDVISRTVSDPLLTDRGEYSLLWDVLPIAEEKIVRSKAT